MGFVDDLKDIDFNEVLDNAKTYFDELELEGLVGWGCFGLGLILLIFSFLL